MESAARCGIRPPGNLIPRSTGQPRSVDLREEEKDWVVSLRTGHTESEQETQRTSDLEYTSKAYPEAVSVAVNPQIPQGALWAG